EASLLLARAHAARKRFDEAVVVLQGARPRIDDPDLALEYLQLAIDVLYWGQRASDELRVIFEDAQTWVDGKLWQQRLQPLRLHVYELGRLWGAAVEESGAVLQDPDLDPEVRRHVEALHASDLFYVGRTREGLERAERMLPQVPLGDRISEFALASWAEMAVESGHDWPALERRLPQLVREAVRADDHVAAGVATLALGILRANA